MKQQQRWQRTKKNIANAKEKRKRRGRAISCVPAARHLYWLCVFHGCAIARDLRKPIARRRYFCFCTSVIGLRITLPTTIDCSSKGGETQIRREKREGEKRSRKRGYATSIPPTSRLNKGTETDYEHFNQTEWREKGAEDGGRMEDVDKETKKGERCMRWERVGKRKGKEDRSLGAERSGYKEKRHRCTATWLSRARIFQYQRWSATADVERGNACDDVRSYIYIYM